MFPSIQPVQPESNLSVEFILETRGLTKEFKGFVAVNRVDLKVQRGHIHALIGPNGAGKTTFFNLLTKFLHPGGGVQKFGQQVKESGFARTIGTNQRMDMAALNFQVDPVDRHESLEFLGQSARFKNELH